MKRFAKYIFQCFLVTEILGLSSCVTLANDDEKMKNAYEMANTLFRGVLEHEDNGSTKKQVFESITKDDVIVVAGVYDRIESIFSLSDIPYTLVDPSDVAKMDLSPLQIVFVNCAGEFSQEGTKKLSEYVEKGGRLITTDWALKNVLEVAFPGFVEHNGIETQDEVVEITNISKNDPVLFGFLKVGDEIQDTSQKYSTKSDSEKRFPLWWIETSSYPIRVLDEERVEVLASSKDLGERYGESAVIVKFRYGRGTVYHLISHFYLQRSELREGEYKKSSMDFAQEKGSGKSMGTGGVFEFSDFAKNDVKYGDIEAASTSYELITRNIIDHQIAIREMEEKSNEKSEL